MPYSSFTSPTGTPLGTCNIASQSTRSCCVSETNCIGLHCVMPIAMTHIAVNQALKDYKNNFDCNIFKNIKKNYFSSILQAFFKLLLRKNSCKLSDKFITHVCSHAIQKILMVWVCIA